MINSKKFSKTFLASFISVAVATPALASYVRPDVNYQYFRDFAENKGLFHAGATNVPVYDKSGNLLGTMFTNGVSMPDFSAVSRSGVATLTSPQYLVSVAHNRGYGTVDFGYAGKNPDAHTYNYLIADRNNYNSGQRFDTDYHAPRLTKLVTEVAPAELSAIDPKNPQPYLDKNRFPMFTRLGSGSQAVRDKQGNVQAMGSAYSYLTGGVPFEINWSRYGSFDGGGNLYQNVYGPLVSYAAPGDSGSPIFGYDKILNRWVVTGVLQSWADTQGNINTFQAARKAWTESQMKQDDAGTITVNNANLEWQAVGNSSKITNAGKTLIAVGLRDTSLTDSVSERPSYNNGKNLVINGTGTSTLTLTSNIDQGAGALYFNTNATVKPKTDQTWLGAGVVVAKDKTVNWQVANPQGDRLSKLGQGTLYVNGEGVNHGDISVGEGKVVLAQREKNGQVQAFNTVGIVSGRSTVVLNSASQVNPNNIYFGYRGGRLDLNGNNLTFNYIQNVDNGAKIANNNPNSTASVTIIGKTDIDGRSLKWGKWGEYGKDIYEYINPWQKNRKDYFVLTLTGNPNSYYPKDGTSDRHWQYLGSNYNQAVQKVVNAKNEGNQYATFQGFLGEQAGNGQTNGKLNFNFSPTNANRGLILTGGSNLNGSINVNNGFLMLSGSPTPHAYDVHNDKDVAKVDDWQNSSFTANAINVNNNASLYIGRNVAEVNANINVNGGGQLTLGFMQKQTPICAVSDFAGVTSCIQGVTLADAGMNSMPNTEVRGNINFQNPKSKLTIGTANLRGAVVSAAPIEMSQDAKWTLTGDSKAPSLMMTGSEVTLNSAENPNNVSRYNTLMLDNLSGSGLINFFTNVAKGVGDKLIINGKATGYYRIGVKDTGVQPSPSNTLELIKTQPNQKVMFSLVNNFVDLGALRYVLMNTNGSYHLWNDKAQVAQPQTSKPQETAKPTTGTTAQTVTQPKYTRVTLLEQLRGLFGIRINATADDSVLNNVLGLANVESTNIESTNIESTNINSTTDIITDSSDNIEPIQADLISRYTNIPLSQLSAQANAVLQIDRKVDQQLREKRTEDFTVWANYDRQKADYSSNLYRAYEQETDLTQLGVESRLGASGRIGAIISQSRSENTFDEGYKGKDRLTSLTVYGKQTWQNGIFAGVDASYGLAKNRISLGKDEEFNRHIASAGASFGKHWDVLGAEVTPSIGARYHRFSSASYQLDGANVDSPAVNFWSYNAGVKIAKAFNVGGVEIKPTLSSYYVDASQKALKLNVNNLEFRQKFGRHFQHEVGVSAKAGAWEVSANAGLLDSNEANRKQKYLGFKLGYSW